MQDHAGDRGVYIRSMASRGHLGGLAWATPQALRVLDAAGCDVVLVETVGVGQSELEIASLADTTLVLLAPGMGDGVQAAKAGILEIADVFVVNKADREGTSTLTRELRTMVGLGHYEPGEWRPPILATAPTTGQGIDAQLAEGTPRWPAPPASRTRELRTMVGLGHYEPGEWRPSILATAATTGQGIDALLAEVTRCWQAQRSSGTADRRRLGRARREVESLAVAQLRQRLPADRL